jgi:organic hydroperoxide reductase OsmC/OhrA
MTQSHHFSARLTWTGAAKGATSSYESYSRDHVIEVPGKPPLPGSADKVFHGDSSRHNPEDLLVMSLSSCHMLTYLAEAARSTSRLASTRMVSGKAKDCGFRSLSISP